MILGIEGVLLLEGHVSHLIIFVDESLNLILCGFSTKTLELSNELALLVEIGTFLATCACVGSLACFEELVASSEELVPELVTELLWNLTYCLPFLLKCDELVTCRFSLGAFCQ